MAREGRVRRVAGRHRGADGRRGWGSREREPVTGCPGPDALTVQLLPHLLAGGELPRAVVGDVLEVAPAIHAASLRPGRGGDRRRDEWAQDEFGTLEAVGSMLAARLDAQRCPCWVDVLDVAGRLVPLNPAVALLGGTAEGVAAGAGGGEDAVRVRVGGALYLDPELGPGTPHGAAVALCRRRFHVAAVRRYRRTAGVPVDPVGLTAAPPPGSIDEEGLYVAELVALDARPAP